MNVEPRIETSIRQLTTAFDDGIVSIWLCGSRANGERGNGADWDLVIFGRREVAAALERGSIPLGGDVDLRFVDVARGEIKRLGRSEGWADFRDWDWTPLSVDEAEYQSAKMSEQLVMLGGEWVEAGALSVSRRRAIRLWPEPDPARPPRDPTVN